MSNILLLYGKREPTNIMVEDIFSELKKENGIDVKAINICDISKDILSWSDIVIGIRTQNILEADVMHIARKSGRLVMEFIDDDLLAQKDFHIRRPLQEFALKKALSSSDIILSFNRNLAKKMCSYAPGARCVITATAVDEDKIIKRKTKNTDELNVVYYSSDGCVDNFDQIVKPILDKLPSATGKSFHWHFFTVHPDLSDTPYHGAVTYYPPMPLNEFRKILAEGAFDIGIAPLVGNEFNSSKYVNKFFEFSQAGIPGIYSKVKPYDGFIEDDRNGIMCENNEESWLAGFIKMTEYTIRETVSKNSQDDLIIRFSKNVIKQKLLQDIPELQEIHLQKDITKGLRLFIIKGEIFKMIDPFARARGRIKTEGVKSTVSWAVDHYILKRK